jgi:hypothetical protein
MACPVIADCCAGVARIVQQILITRQQLAVKRLILAIELRVDRVLRRKLRVGRRNSLSF